MLGLGELERVRDELATRVAEARLASRARRRWRPRNRELLRADARRPRRLKWVRVSRHDVGEPGCGTWHSRPRFGMLGMLMGGGGSRSPPAARYPDGLRPLSKKPKRDQAQLDERPPAPWGSFPLAELTVLAGIVMLIVGIAGQNPTAIGVGVVLGGLGGLEVSVREHFAGYRSHTTLLAGTVFVLTVGGLFYLAGLILADLPWRSAPSPSSPPSWRCAAPSSGPLGA